jgi:hypothetical protein
VLAKDFKVACWGIIDANVVDVDCKDIIVKVDVWDIVKLKHEIVKKVNCKSIRKVDCEDTVKLVCWGTINISSEGTIELVCKTVMKLSYKSTVEINCCGTVPVGFTKVCKPNHGILIQDVNSNSIKNILARRFNFFSLIFFVRFLLTSGQNSISTIIIKNNIGSVISNIGSRTLQIKYCKIIIRYVFRDQKTI